MSDALKRAVRLALTVIVVLVACGAAWAAPGHRTRPPWPKAGRRTGPRPLSLREALISLPAAGLFGAALAFRPQRRGTPPASPR